MTSRKITTSYAVYEPDHDGDASERGWEDSVGVEFETVLEAAVWLIDSGAVHPSSSWPSSNLWFSSDPYQDSSTGTETEKSFHPSGFSDREIATLYHAVTGFVRLGHPDSLGYCWVDEWDEFAEGLEIDHCGTITSSDDPLLIGIPAAVAYVEKFGDEPGAWSEAEDGAEYVELNNNDAVFFCTLDKPVIVARTVDGKRRYNFETTDYLESKMSAPRPA